MKTKLAGLLILLLAGCAQNYVKVVKLDAAGDYLPFATASTGGCIVEKKGNINGITLTYTDKECVAEIKGDQR